MRRLMAVLAHPDDESLGFGGTLARYASEGVTTALVTATRGDRGRFGDARPGDIGHPGLAALGVIREAELRAAATTLGVHDVSVLGFGDQHVDRAEPRQIVAEIATHIRRVRPSVVVTFGPDGAYGHPDHIALSQFTSAAILAAADATCTLSDGEPHREPHAVSKLYFLAWPSSTWDAYQHAFKTRFHGGRDRAARGAMARLGHHERCRHQQCGRHRLARRAVSRVPGRQLRSIADAVGNAVAWPLGTTVLLSRL